VESTDREEGEAGPWRRKGKGEGRILKRVAREGAKQKNRSSKKKTGYGVAGLGVLVTQEKRGSSRSGGFRSSEPRCPRENTAWKEQEAELARLKKGEGGLQGGRERQRDRSGK